MKNQIPESFGRLLRATLLASAGLSLLAATSASAQEAAAPSDDKTIKLEKFVVTGSNIPTTETASEARTFPVQTIDRRAIEASGLFNTVELLQKTALSNGGSVPFTNNATGFTPGGASTSLRGLGPEATLVLINGRRVTPYPIGTGGTTAFVDLNSIPLNAIERIEVLKDGASATYGADAVAGVVNIILRRDFNGAVANISVGNTTNKDSTEFSASAIYGATSDKGSVTVGANFQKRNAIFNRDRSYSEIPPFLSTNSSPPNLQLTRAAVEEALGLAPGGNIPGIAAGNNLFFATSGPTLNGGTTAPAPGNQNANNRGGVLARDYTYSTGRLSRFNFNEFAGSFPEITRQGLFAAWDRELSPNIRTYGDAFFQQVHQIDELAPYATGSFSTPGQTTIVIPSRTPNPILTPAEIAAGNLRTAVPGAFNPFNPFNQDIAGGSRIRLAEFGNRIYHNRNTAFAFTEGVRVSNLADKWNLDAKIRFSSLSNQLNARLISTSRFLRAMNAADPIFNPASPSFIGTTQPYNPFGFFRNEIPSNAVPVAFATHFQRDESSSTMADAGVVLNTGELMSLSAGEVGFALGADFRREAISQSPDSTLQAGDILGAPPGSPIQRQRKIASYFTEFEVPLVSDKNPAGFARALSLNFAARYESFLTSSRHAFVPKVGLRWTPRDETLVVRASWGKGFAEPSLFQLFSGKVAGLSPITDPVSSVFEPEQNVTVTGNKTLKSETSKSYNVGVVWSPKGALEGFTFAADAWQIQRTGQVLANPQDTVNRSLTNNLVPGESLVRDGAGNLVQVNTIFRNVGDFKVNGLDLATSYVVKTENMGRFDLGVNAIMLNRFDYQTAPTIASDNLVGKQDPRASPGDDGVLKWKGQGWVGWNFHGLNARFTANYTGGFLDNTDAEDPINTAFKVKATVVYDLQLSYTLFPSKGSADRGWWSDLKVTAGATNLFDKDPPFASGGGGNSNGYPGFLYTDQGRFVYFGLEKKL